MRWARDELSNCISELQGLFEGGSLWGAGDSAFRVQLCRVMNDLFKEYDPNVAVGKVFGSDLFFSVMLEEQLKNSTVRKMCLGEAIQARIDPIAHVLYHLDGISQRKLELLPEHVLAFAMVSQKPCVGLDT